MVRSSVGYTLIELMVTLGVMSFIAAITLYGLGQYNNGQQLVDVRREFVSNLRGVQNKVNNGADGSQYKIVSILAGNQYNLAGTIISLPATITISPNNIYICFANPKLTSFTANQCGNCPAGSFFICQAGVSRSSGYVDVTLSRGITSKVVRIEGSGININRIYEQP